MMNRLLKHFFCLITFLHFSSFLLAQTQTVADSLFQKIQVSADDTHKVKLYEKLSSEFDYFSSKERILYLQDAYELSKKISFLPGIERTLYRLATINYHRQMYSLSFTYALLYVDHIEKHGNTESLIRSQLLMGSLYQSRKNYKKALEAFKQVVAYANENEKYELLKIAYGNLGNLYYQMPDLDSSLTYALTAYKIHTLYPTDSSNIANTLNLIANIQLQKKEIDAALESATNAMHIYTKIGVLLGQANSNQIMAEIMLAKKEYAKAEKIITATLDDIKEFEWISTHAAFHNLLHKALFAQGKHKEAYLAFEKYTLLNDSMQAKSDEAKQLEMEVKYELGKKEKMLAEAETELTRQELELKNKRTRQNMLYALLAAVLLAMIASMWAYRQKRKDHAIIQAQKQEVEKQKKDIEDKQKEILDSIRYAKRIQDCMLPREKIIYRNVCKLKGGVKNT